MQAGEHAGARRWTVKLCTVCSEKMAMECRQMSTLEHQGERWNCALCAVRKWLWDAGRWALWSTKLNDETRRLGQGAKRSAAVRGQADVGRVRDVLPARFSGRSRADLLLERQSTALLPSCARPVYCCTKIIKPPNQNHCCFLFTEKVGISCWWRLIIDLEILRQEVVFKKKNKIIIICFTGFFSSLWVEWISTEKPHIGRDFCLRVFSVFYEEEEEALGRVVSCLFFFPLVTHLLVL